MLHTPLMSGANAVHGVIVVGAMLVAATADDPLRVVLAFVAVVLGTINVAGGFVVTDRMLEMFRGRGGPGRGGPGRGSSPSGGASPGGRTGAAGGDGGGSGAGAGRTSASGERQGSR